MDLPFLQIRYIMISKKLNCFNPCSYGSSVLTYWVKFIIGIIDVCFNPCSYGSSVLTGNMLYAIGRKKHVSILVLMDLPFLL